MRSQKTIISIFLAVICLSFIVYHLFATPQNDFRENRFLTSFPDVKSLSLEDLPSAFNEYVNDNAPFRRELVRLNAAINYQVFKTVESPQVLLGKNGWLFYKDGPNYAPMGNYQGTVFFSDDEHETALSNAVAVDSWFKKNDKQLVLFIAPSKDIVYSEYMPDAYPVIDEKSRTDKFVELLTNNSDIVVKFPLDALLSAKEHNDVYFKYDAHWNTRGALVGLDMIFEEIGLETKPFHEYMFMKNTNSHEGDLANLSAIYDFCTDDYDYTVANYDFGAKDSRSIAIFRDSFSTYFEPFLDARFQQWSLLPFAECKLSAVQNSDIVVLAVTERNLHEMLNMLATLSSEIPNS